MLARTASSQQDRATRIDQQNARSDPKALGLRHQLVSARNAFDTRRPPLPESRSVPRDTHWRFDRTGQKPALTYRLRRHLGWKASSAIRIHEPIRQRSANTGPAYAEAWKDRFSMNPSIGIATTSRQRARLRSSCSRSAATTKTNSLSSISRGTSVKPNAIHRCHGLPGNRLNYST